MHVKMITQQYASFTLSVFLAYVWCMYRLDSPHTVHAWPSCLVSVGLRPIANLGSSSVAVFPGSQSRLSCKRPRRREKVKLVFKPVNKQLQSVLQVMSHHTIL